MSLDEWEGDISESSSTKKEFVVFSNTMNEERKNRGGDLIQHTARNCYFTELLKCYRIKYNL